MPKTKRNSNWWRYWLLLTRPAQTIQGDEARQLVTMLSALSLALFLASLINGLTLTFINFRFAAAPALIIFSTGGLLIVYALSRTKYYRSGAILLLIIIILSIATIIFASPTFAITDIQALYYLVVLILLASLFLSIRTTILISSLCLLITSTIFFIPGVPTGQAYSLLLFTAVMSLLFLIATTIRNSYLLRLHASEERFRHLTQNSPDTIFVFNLQSNRIEYINRDSFLGYSLEELEKSNSLVEYVYPEDHAAALHFWYETSQQTASKTRAIDYRLRHKTGNWEWIHSRVTALSFTPEGTAEQILVVLTVITERKQADELLQSVTAAAPNAMIVANAQEEILFANAQVTAIFGYEIAAIIGQKVTILIPERFQHSHPALYETYFQHPHPRPLGRQRYLFGRRHDGQEFPVEISLSPINTQTGPLVLVSMTDITERQRAEQTIRQQAEYLRILLEQTPIGIVVINKEGYVKDANSRSLQILGLENKTLAQGLTVFALPALVDTGIGPLLERVLASGQKEEKEIWYTANNGKKSYLLVRVVPHFDGEGQQIGLIILAEDLTQRVQAEEGMRQMQKMESLGVLAGGIAHDFNNLLVAILGQTSLALAKTKEENLSRPHLQKAITATERAAQLTQQLLAYSGRGQFQIISLQLNTLIEENLHLFAATIPKHIHLHTSLTPSLPQIEADLAQIQQIVMNLIINAAEAIGEQAGTITIATGTQSLGPHDEKYWHYTLMPLLPGLYVILELHDDGVGIPPENLAKIFDPFFTTKPTGHGLGLAAVIGIVKGHKGGLTVYSEIGKGTTFKLLFPIYDNAPAILPTDATSTSLALQGQVLVIDDEASVREAVADILGLKGVEVIVAADGETGLALYQERQEAIVLVLLDLSMPGWSGERTLRELRRINPQVRVILSSGYNEIEATQRFVGKALTGFLQKPYSADTLLSAVNHYLGQLSLG